MIRTKIMVVAAMLALPLLAAYKMYEVVPYRNYINQTPINTPISQTFINVVDSLTEVQIWVGDIGKGAAYNVEVIDTETSERLAYKLGVVPEQSWYWMPCTLMTEQGAKPVRGKTYKAVISRADGAPISYAYDPTNPYPHGSIVNPSGLESYDLAARVYGVAGVDGIFGIHPLIAFSRGSTAPWDTANWATCVQHQKEIGAQWAHVGYHNWWQGIQPQQDSWDWGWIDSIMHLYKDAGIQIAFLVNMATRWAHSGYYRPTSSSIARNLFYGVEDDSNFVGRFCYEFARRYGPRGTKSVPVALYQPHCEPTLSALGSNDTLGWWRAGRGLTYDSLIRAHIVAHGGNSWAGRKSSFLEVYSRFITVMDSATKLAATHLGVPAESMPRTAGYIIARPSVEHYTVGEWLTGYKDYGADGSFQVASYTPFPILIGDVGRIRRFAVPSNGQ